MQLLDHVKKKQAREFKEAWYSIGTKTINQQIHIYRVFLQLKHTSNVNKCIRLLVLGLGQSYK